MASFPPRLESRNRPIFFQHVLLKVYIHAVALILHLSVLSSMALRRSTMKEIPKTCVPSSSEDMSRLFDSENALLSLVRQLQSDITTLQHQSEDQAKTLASEQQAKKEALQKAGRPNFLFTPLRWLLNSSLSLTTQRRYSNICYRQGNSIRPWNRTMLSLCNKKRWHRPRYDS